MKKYISKSQLFAFLSLVIILFASIGIIIVLENGNSPSNEERIIDYVRLHGRFQFLLDNVSIIVFDSSDLPNFNNSIRIQALNESFVNVQSERYLNISFYFYFENITIITLDFGDWNITIDNLVFPFEGTMIHEINPIHSPFLYISANHLFYSSVLIEKSSLLNLVNFKGGK